ncbi:MAG: hypothetical protein N2110_03750 [Flavobacteriales bacterium]|nr:hypothetical protein [Flavobacteriales bacterium]MCX7768123.1 hypothetical protein [Flavobacteriales bacterium]MDW8409585.1 hypothetical protein [Flavobacteriales bacterium]
MAQKGLAMITSLEWVSRIAATGRLRAGWGGQPKASTALVAALEAAAKDRRSARGARSSLSSGASGNPRRPPRGPA